MEGTLRYNSNEKRFGVWSGKKWENEGLHCGDCLKVLLNDTWVETRIELNYCTGEWILDGLRLKGDQLEGLYVFVY